MPKFPFTNYHELNLDWILKKVTALFDASEENARTIRTYDSRLTYAELMATNAGSAATAAQELADAAAENADSALSVAGTADAKADSALTAATDAAGAVAGALTTAQEARQIAGNAQSAAADAGALANDASNAASTAQQTADTNAGNISTLQTATDTNTGNISTLQTDVTDLNSRLNEERTLNEINTESIGVNTGVGTGPMANTRRWFMPDIIPANTVIKDTNYFCASATSGTVDIELWEKDGDTLTRVLIVTQTPTASSWNKAVLNYNADNAVMISFKPSAGSIRSDSLATGKITYASADLTSENLSFSAFTTFQNLQICANVNYLIKSDNIFVVDKNGNGDFTSFSQALINTFANHPNAELIIKPGVYNIYQEMIDIYGSNYWETLTTSQADQKRNLLGLPFGNCMKIHGNNGAIVTMDNISANANIKTYFSILHAEDDPESKYQGAEIDNIVFDCKNIRYVAHFDFGEALNSGEYIINNCKMTLDNSQNEQRTNAYVIGTGGGAYTTYTFTNNYIYPVFPSNTRDKAGIYYHNSSYADAKNRCNIINNYIANAGTVRADALGNSQNKCLVMITGNSIGEAVIIGNTNDNLEVVEWNNLIRS